MLAERPGLQRVRVDLGDGDRCEGVLPDASSPGRCAVGDEVVCNTTAVELGLGTGGWHVVHWNLARDDLDRARPEHIMKLRYTSLQVDAGAGSDHPEACRPSLDGVPVVVCSVHSQVAMVAARIRCDARPGAGSPT